jgi:hypothetical protein
MTRPRRCDHGVWLAKSYRLREMAGAGRAPVAQLSERRDPGAPARSRCDPGALLARRDSGAPLRRQCGLGSLTGRCDPGSALRMRTDTSSTSRLRTHARSATHCAHRPRFVTILALLSTPLSPPTPSARTEFAWRSVTSHPAAPTLTAVAALAVLIRLIPAALFFGTSDVLAWEQLAQAFLAGENFYATQLHNWPVLWIYFAASAELVHDATQVPFPILVKLPPIAADATIAFLLARKALRLGLAYAVSPISILITGYHGQFDALMLAPSFLAWTIWTEGSGVKRLVASALSLGVGVWFKPVPLLLLPVFLPRIGNNRDRALFTLLSLAPATLGTLPYFVMWPEEVAANFLGYSSWFGQWGYPVVWMVVEYIRNGTIPWWLPDPNRVSIALRVIYTAGRFILVAALGFTWWWTMFHRRATVLHGIIATFAAFYSATVGFGVQYLLWIVPFALAGRDRFIWPYTVASTLLLLVAYSLGLAYQVVEPIPDNGPSVTEFMVKLASLPAWVVCCAWTVRLLRRRDIEATDCDARMTPVCQSA